MTNPEYLKILLQGAEEWNNWRNSNIYFIPNFVDVDLSGKDLSGYNLTNCSFYRCKLNNVKLNDANLAWARIFHTELRDSTIRNSNTFIKGNQLDSFFGNNLRWCSFAECDLTNTDLSWNLLECASFHNVCLKGANISNCMIHGISVWNAVIDDKTNQSDLVITNYYEPILTVDNLEIAQFIYLLLENKEIRKVIDTLTSKAVLILGRFTEERKVVLKAIKDELRKRNYLPILFDFEKPASKDLTETILTLANISRFVIADVTDAKSIPQELSHIVPHLPSLAVVPIILESQREYAMFEHFERYPWVLPLYPYYSSEDLLLFLNEKVIEPAERKVIELREVRK